MSAPPSVVTIPVSGEDKTEKPRKRDAFTIDDRLTVLLDVDLAAVLAQTILDSDTENPALIALAKKLERVV